MVPELGDVIEGKYRIDRKLGEGGMGTVFEATHVLRKAKVALKFISKDALEIPEVVERFMNEAITASEIQSDHVVRVLDVARHLGTPYMVMECLAGVDLCELLRRESKAGRYLDTSRVVHLVLQTLRALSAAHVRGIVHRDLKPANVFVITHDGEPDFVKLLDFGISKRESGDVRLTATNVSMGTPLYMAPEQAKSARDADARSDIYSTAAIMYELLTGRPVYKADSYNMVLFKLFSEDPVSIGTYRPDLPSALCDVVHRGLSKEPTARFPTARAFGEALAPFADIRSKQVIARLAVTPAEIVELQRPLTPDLALSATAISAGNPSTYGEASLPIAPARSASVSQPTLPAPPTTGPGPDTSVSFGSADVAPKQPRFARTAVVAVASLILGLGTALGIYASRSTPTPAPSAVANDFKSATPSNSGSSLSPPTTSASTVATLGVPKPEPQPTSTSTAKPEASIPVAAKTAAPVVTSKAPPASSSTAKPVPTKKPDWELSE